jgi:drug/metabolite transporter (DMT)-like permease
MLIWATTYPITDVLLVTWDPLSLGMTRVLGAGVLLGLIAIALGATRLPWRDWPIKQACLTGAVGLGLGTVLMNFGFLYSNPVNVAVIATTVPVISVIMGRFQGEERLTLRIGIALCFALAGGVLVSISSLETEVGFQGGELLMVIAVVLYTWFSRVSAKQLRVIPAVPRSALTLTAAGFTLLPILLFIQWSGVVELSFSWSLSEFGLPVCLILGVGFSMGFWMLSADRIGVTVAAIHINVVPFYVVILMLWFGGSLIFIQIAGAILVAVGVMLAQVKSELNRSVGH